MPVTCAQFLWREQGASGGLANSGVIWRMPVDLQGAGLWAQVSLEALVLFINIKMFHNTVEIMIMICFVLLS